MKLQDKFKYDSAILGLNNQYIASEDGTFFINHPCILIRDQTLIQNKIYLLIHECNQQPEGMSYSVVKFIDCYYSNAVLNIFIQEIYSNEPMRIQIDFNESKTQCPWLLLDDTNLQALMDKVAEQMVVYDYCIGGKG